MANSLRTFDYYNIFQQMDDLNKYYFNNNFKLYKKTGVDSVSSNKTNIYLENGTLFFEVFAPGFSKSDIKIDVGNNTLSVTGKKDVVDEKSRKFVMREFSNSFANFHRNFSLPEGLNVEAADASYNCGILTISIPYATKEKELTRNISIN